jgi:hypothetical protein
MNEEGSSEDLWSHRSSSRARPRRAADVYVVRGRAFLLRTRRRRGAGGGAGGGRRGGKKQYTRGIPNDFGGSGGGGGGERGRGTVGPAGEVPKVAATTTTTTTQAKRQRGGGRRGPPGARRAHGVFCPLTSSRLAFYLGQTGIRLNALIKPLTSFGRPGGHRVYARTPFLSRPGPFSLSFLSRHLEAAARKLVRFAFPTTCVRRDRRPRRSRI